MADRMSGVVDWPKNRLPFFQLGEGGLGQLWVVCRTCGQGVIEYCKMLSFFFNNKFKIDKIALLEHSCILKMIFSFVFPILGTELKDDKSVVLSPLSSKKVNFCHFYLWIKGCANFEPITPVHKRRIVLRCIQLNRGPPSGNQTIALNLHPLRVGWRNLFSSCAVCMLCQFLVLVGKRFWFTYACTT